MSQFKAIKIVEDNAIAIEDALKAVNGRAETHAYTEFYEVERLAEMAECELSALDLPKADRAGARWTETSGDKVPNACGKKWHGRNATRVVLERRSAGWYLLSAQKVQIGQSGSGAGRLALTQKQADEAARRLRARFDVLAAA
jgi:hypothetical protein